MESNKDIFDTVISLDESKTEAIQVSMSTESEVESKREELIYFRETASDYNKKSLWVALSGVIIFVFISFSGLLSIDVTKLMKVMAIGFGIASGLLLLVSLFFTFLFTFSYLKIRKALGIAISGFGLSCLLPFLGIFIWAAIPLWNKLITNRVNKLFIEAGLEPINPPEEII